MSKKKEILLAGHKLFLFERSAKEVYTINDYIRSRRDNTSFADNISIACQTIVDSLNPNIFLLKWYQIIKRFKYKRMFTIIYLFENLKTNEIENFCSIISTDLEGNGSAKDGEKKKHAQLVSQD